MVTRPAPPRPRIASGSQFRHYSITIETTALQAGAGDAVPFAQLTRLGDPSNTIASGPGLLETKRAVLITDPRFM